MTFERVKFTLGLPLLRRAFQEQVRVFILLLWVLELPVLPVWGVLSSVPVSALLSPCPEPLTRLSLRNREISRSKEVFVHKTNIILSIKLKYLSNVNNCF